MPGLLGPLQAALADTYQVERELGQGGLMLDADVVAREGDADTIALMWTTGGHSISSDATADGPTMLG